MLLAQLVGAVGGLLIFVAQVWVAIAAFRQGLFWGLAVLCIPFVAFVFIVLNWSDTKRAVIAYVLGSLMVGWSANQLQLDDVLRQGRGHQTSEA